MEPPLFVFQQRYLEENLPRYLDMLETMVSINSFTTNSQGVNRLGQMTADLFADLGFEAEFVQAENKEYGRHLILTRPGTTDKTIGLVSHLDTVFPPEEEKGNKFHWRPEGERIYGPGTVDIKGGTVLIYMMLDTLRMNAPEEFTAVNWIILLDAAEEAIADDFGVLCLERLAGALGCLVFEGGHKQNNTFKVVRARKGMAICRIEVTGRAAHAGSSHEQGTNAIVQLADIISRLAALTDYERRVTVNVGVVSGGTVTNRVPHQAAARLEMRAFDDGVYAETLAKIQAVAKLATVKSAADGFSCQVSVIIERETKPWPGNEATDRLLAIWQEAAERLNLRVEPEERGGLSDGNNTWHVLPTLDGLGVAGGNAHCSERSEDGTKDQEYCVVASFVPKALLNVTAVLDLLAAV